MEVDVQCNEVDATLLTKIMRIRLDDGRDVQFATYMKIAGLSSIKKWNTAIKVRATDESLGNYLRPFLDPIVEVEDEQDDGDGCDDESFKRGKKRSVPNFRVGNTNTSGGDLTEGVANQQWTLFVRGSDPAVPLSEDFGIKKVTLKMFVSI